MVETVLGKALATNWQKIVQRQESVLMLNNIIGGIDKANTEKVLGTDLGYNHYLYVNSNIYWKKEDSDENIECIEKIVENGKMFELKDFVLKWRNLGENLLVFSQKVSEMELTKKTNQELKKLFAEFSEKNHSFSTSLLLPLGIERVIEGKIRKLLEQKAISNKLFESYFLALVFPHKDQYATKEMISIYKIAKTINEEKAEFSKLPEKIKKQIEAHMREFGWINARWYIGDAWSFSELVQRLKLLVKEDPPKKLSELESIVETNNRKTKEIIKELAFAVAEKELVELTKSYVAIRTYRGDVFNKAGFLVRNLLREIGKRNDLNFEDIIFLSIKEINALFEGTKIMKALPEQRRNGFAAIHIDGEFFVFSQQELTILKERIDTERTEIKSELKGSIANRGIVRGTAKIVLGKEDLTKVQKGDILIAPMTTPDFVPAMERAAAFVTDEGGILCHAAIVSREMGKPCITGTKEATKIFKNGDCIEVDANKGIVRKISK